MMCFTTLKGVNKSLNMLCQPKLVFILHSNRYLNSALEDKSVDWSKLEELLLGEPAHYLGWFHGGAQAAGEQGQQGGEQHTTLHCVLSKTGGFLEHFFLFLYLLYNLSLGRVSHVTSTDVQFSDLKTSSRRQSV